MCYDGIRKAIPIAPTEFSKRRSATQLLQRQARSPSAACDSQEEDTFYQSRHEGGYWLGFAPKCLRIVIAIGQQSTDSHQGQPTEKSAGPRTSAAKQDQLNGLLASSFG